MAVHSEAPVCFPVDTETSKHAVGLIVGFRNQATEYSRPRWQDVMGWSWCSVQSDLGGVNKYFSKAKIMLRNNSCIRCQNCTRPAKIGHMYFYHDCTESEGDPLTGRFQSSQAANDFPSLPPSNVPDCGLGGVPIGPGHWTGHRKLFGQVLPLQRDYKWTWFEGRLDVTCFLIPFFFF